MKVYEYPGWYHQKRGIRKYPGWYHENRGMVPKRKGCDPRTCCEVILQKEVND